MQKKFLYIHPYFFSIASVLYIYSTAAIIVSPDQVIRTIVFEILLLVLLTLPFYWIVRDWNLTSILLSIFVFGFFLPREFFYLSATTSFLAIILWILIARILRKKVDVCYIALVLGVVSTLFLGLFIWKIMVPFSQFSWGGYQKNILSFSDERLAKTNPAARKPDIYFIVLDGYGRSDNLKEYFGYENIDFEEFLKSKGFIIPSQSRSNYPKTALSIASALNMDYISNLVQGAEGSYFWWLVKPYLNNSRVRNVLEAEGYKSVAIATDWGITDNSTVDIYYNPKPIHLNEFERYFISITPLKIFRPLIGKYALISSYESHRKLITYTFDVLSNLHEVDGPKFVFVHIVSPHPPFVFDEVGNPVEPDYPFSFNDANDFPRSKEQYRDNYIKQLKFINSQLEVAINSILENSDQPPIILLQADHGPGMFTDFRSSENTCLNERFGVFTAYYLPGFPSDVIPSDITPVNLFRIIFNEYFGYSFHLLDQFHYYYKDTIYIFSGEDVSAQVNTCQVK